MFGVGWTEMLLIGVVALIVIGPKDLPVVMNRLGKAIGTIRRLGNEFQREINKTTGLDQITDLRRTLTEPLKQTAAEITREFNKTTSTGATVPSGVITPKTPGAESVVDEIKASIAAPAAAPAAAIAPAVAVESPAPAEAMAPVAKPVRKPRAKKTAAVPAPPPVVEASPARKALLAEEAAVAPKAPRKPRAAKPKSEA